MLVDKKKEAKLALQQWQLLSIIFVLILITVISVIMISKALNPSPNVKDILYSYNKNNNIDYKIHLYENSFYDEEFLGMDKTYTSSLIKNIETNMQYYYSNTTKNKLTYTYNIIGTIIGSYGDISDETKDSLWNKSYILVDTKAKTLELGNSVNINEKINIDFPSYVKQVEDYKKQLKLSISAYLDVVMNINVDNGKFKDTEIIEMKIPLSETTTKITTNYNKEESKTIFKDNYNNKKMNMPRVILGSSLLIFCTVMYILTFRILFKVTRKSEYQLTLNKILKNYGEVIVEVEKFTIHDKANILSITNINDMIDLEEELHIPIVYYERFHEREGWFIIQHDNHIYRYILKAETKDEFDKMAKRRIKVEKEIIEKVAKKQNINKSN